MTRIYAFLGAIAAFVGVWVMGRREGRADERTAADKKELEAHARINKADTGGGSTDDQRMRELARLGQEWDRD